ncbi:MAG: hypothetical protein RLZZ241_1286 [Bacteroidota bacterium]
MINKILFLANALCFFGTTFAQFDSIPLSHNTAKNISWEGSEKHYFSPIWDTQVVTNVSSPSLEVFRPVRGTENGAAVIVAPGGGLFGLSIESEGKQVAQWLAQKGFTAFVLKYRLVPTGTDGVLEISEQFTSNPAAAMQRVQQVLPYSVSDGLAAVAYVRSNAASYNIDSHRIGFMGFSAGGAVTLGVGYEGLADQAPDFLVPVYPWTDAYAVKPAPEAAPPMLIICATDDPLGLANGSIALYQAWHKENKNVGLHMYNKGGHGFGMKIQGVPSDHWIERFFDWYQVLF